MAKVSGVAFIISTTSLAAWLSRGGRLRCFSDMALLRKGGYAALLAIDIHAGRVARLSDDFEASVWLMRQMRQRDRSLALRDM